MQFGVSVKSVEKARRYEPKGRRAGETRGTVTPVGPGSITEPGSAKSPGSGNSPYAGARFWTVCSAFTAAVYTGQQRGAQIRSRAQTVQRILQPGEIEAFAQRAVPRIRLPDRGTVFSIRARRLRELSANHTIGDYLRLMAACCCRCPASGARELRGDTAEHRAACSGTSHRMPVIHAWLAARAPLARCVGTIMRFGGSIPHGHNAGLRGVAREPARRRGRRRARRSRGMSDVRYAARRQGRFSWRPFFTEIHSLDGEEAAEQEIAVLEQRGDAAKRIPQTAVVGEPPSGLELTGVPVDTQIVVVAVRFRREVDHPAPSGGDYFNEERMATEIREACLGRGVESLEGVGV